MLKLKLQYYGHLMQRTDSLEKTLMLGKIEGRRRGDNRGWDGWMASRTQWTWVWVNSGSWFWTGRPGVLQFMGLQRVGYDWATEPTNWKTSICILLFLVYFFNCLFFWLRWVFVAEWAFLQLRWAGTTLVVVCGLTAVASLVAEHGL